MDYGTWGSSEVMEMERSQSIGDGVDREDGEDGGGRVKTSLLQTLLSPRHPNYPFTPSPDSYHSFWEFYIFLWTSIDLAIANLRIYT